MLAIPKEALAEGIKTPYVYAVTGDSIDLRATRRDLVLGREVGERVEVLKGLVAGETVVLSGQLNLTDGSKVRLSGKH